MENHQYNRQKLYYRWALVLCIVALTGYSFYFLYERFLQNVPLFVENKSLFLRLALLVYFSILLAILNRLPAKFFNLLGFFIAVPLGWMITFISFLTVGFEGITVTGFIFLIMASAIVFDFGVKAFVLALVLIIGFHFGLLSFYPEKQPEEILNHIFLLGLSCVLGLTTNYLVNIIKENEARVLKEREMLLKEIHHRVKNNLQVISSLLNLQAGSITDNSTKSVVLESQSRVKSMALIHQLLYESERFTNIDFSKYLHQLMSSIHGSFCTPGKDIRFEISASTIVLDIDKAIPLGLITNELATNAYKYAFDGMKDGRISIALTLGINENYVLTISDNGRGLPENLTVENSETLGLKLVNLLTCQIDGSIRYYNSDGAVYEIAFNNSIKK